MGNAVQSLNSPLWPASKPSTCLLLPAARVKSEHTKLEIDWFLNFAISVFSR